MVIYLYPPTFF